MTFEEIFDEQARKTKLFICEEYIAKVTTPQLELFDVEECKRINSFQKRLLEVSMKDNDSNEVGFLVNLVDWSYMTAFGGERGIAIKSNPEAKELLMDVDMIRKFNKPTPEEIEARRKMYDEAEKLGIDLMSYDDEQELTKEQKRYVRKAIILLCAGKTVPEEIVKHLPKKAMA